MTPWVKFWIGILLVKLGLSYFFPLSADEAYYWVWSKHLTLSYFDHPPMIGYLIAIGRIFFEDLGGYALRWPGVIIGHLTLLIWDQLFKNYLTFYQRLSAWMIYLSHPITGLGSLILTPDLPFLFFFSLTFMVAEKLYLKPSSSNYILLGIMLGLGFLSKYHIVLAVPMLLTWIYQRNAWPLLFSKKIVLTLAFGLLLCLPVLIWNYQNNWVSFAFQLDHGLGGATFSLKSAISYFLGQILILHPVVIILIFSKWKSMNVTELAYLKASLFIFIFFMYSSLKSHVEANWTTQALPSIWFIVSRHLSKGMLWVIAFPWFLLSLIATSHWLVPWLPMAPQKLNEIHHFREIIEAAKKCPFVYGDTYQTSSIIFFYTNKPAYKFPGLNRFDHYDLMSPSPEGVSAFCFVGSDQNELPAKIKETHLIELIKTFDNKKRLYMVRKQE